MAVTALPRLMAEALTPPAGAVCISITNPAQSPARLAPSWAAVLRLGFHDTDRIGGGFTAMTRQQARAVIAFATEHRTSPIFVHCEAGASRSVGVAAFLAAWRSERLTLQDDVLFPNTWVLRQLRIAGLLPAVLQRDPRLLQVCLKGPMALRASFAAPHLYVPSLF